MRSFTDAQGRTWLLAINVTTLKRVKALTGVDLLKLFDDGMKGLAEFVSDPVQLVDVLYAVCRDEALTRGVSDEDFGRAMHGDCIETAATALLEELTDFFPDPRRRNIIRQLLTTAMKASEEILNETAQKVSSLTPDQFRKLLNVQSMNVPGSSELTPAP